MRSIRANAVGVAAVAGLAAAVLLFRPGTGPTAVAQTRPAQPPGGAAAADLALVPADAVGFVHVRLADIWKNEMFAGFRKTWEKAGPKALAALDKQFVPAPSTISRATLFVTLDPKRKEPAFFGVLAFSAPFNPEQVAKVYLPNARKAAAGGKAVYSDPQAGIAVHFPDNRHIVVGMPGALEAYLAKPPAKGGPMAAALKLAGSGKAVVAAVNVAGLPIPPDALDQLPPEVRPLLKAQQVILALDLGAEAKVELKAVYANDAAAADAEKAVRALAEMGRKELAKARKEFEAKLFDPQVKAPRPPEDLPEAVGSVFALGALNQLDELLADTSWVKRTGAELGLSVTMPRELAALAGGGGAIAIGLLLPAVQKVRQAAARTTSANNLKQIGLAIHNYEAVHGRLPEDIKDKTGKPILSWRVAILPFIEQQALHNQFKLDEPWDSPNNRRASQTVIRTYLSPGAAEVAAPGGYGMTHYKGVAGPGTIFDPRGKLRIPDITDGTSNTIMVIETEEAIPWAKPGDFQFDPAKPLPKLASPGMVDMFQALMGDGSVRVINTRTVSEKTLKAAFTRAGGEVLGLDWNK
jgi:hypothetical protein